MLLMQQVLHAQPLNTERSYRAFPYFTVGGGLMTFKGDIAKTGLTTARPSLNLGGGYSRNLFRAELNYSDGKVIWNSKSYSYPSNFSARIQGLALSVFWQPFVPVETRRVAPYFGVGVGNTWFSSYTDATDSEGRYYNYWQDGTIRDKPQYGNTKANILKRDYTYESPLAIGQQSVYFPLSAGASLHLHRSAVINFGFTALMLQSDNIDRNTSTPAWDRLFQVQGSITWRFIKRPENSREIVSVSRNVPGVKAPVSYINDSLLKDVDLEAIIYADEDGDGVNDMIDQCYGTPKGWPVDARGCPIDTDSDGIPDHIDAEPDSPKGAWVDVLGRELSEDLLQKQYNDSLGLFTATLRAQNKNSRPYQVKKHIPDSRFETFARMLEKNPEWQIIHPQKVALPEELRPFDFDKNGQITMSELDRAFHAMFDGTNRAITPELFSKAIRHVFEAYR